jgi:hypothetical protein
VAFFSSEEFLLGFGGRVGHLGSKPPCHRFSIQNRSVQTEEAGGGAGSKAGMAVERMIKKNEPFSPVVPRK